MKKATLEKIPFHLLPNFQVAVLPMTGQVEGGGMLAVSPVLKLIYPRLVFAFDAGALIIGLPAVVSTIDPTALLGLKLLFLGLFIRVL